MRARRASAACARGEVRERHQVVGDLIRGDVDEAAFECPVLLDGALAGQLPVDVVIGAEDGGDECEDLRLVPLDPAQLGDHKLLVDAVAGAAHEGGRIEFGGELAHLGAAASVALLDRGSEKLARSVEKHDGGKHAGDADRRDRLGADAARLELGDDGADVRPPLGGDLPPPTRPSARKGSRGARRCRPPRRVALSECRSSTSCRCRGRGRRSSGSHSPRPSLCRAGRGPFRGSRLLVVAEFKNNHRHTNSHVCVALGSAVHDVEVQPFGTGLVDGSRLVAEPTEVGRQNGRRDRNRLHPPPPPFRPLCSAGSGAERLQT